jgi:Dolichyl-phosphate-mannose-protein mannosyltransferase
MEQKNLKTTLKAFLKSTNNSKYLLVIFAISSFLIPFLIGNYSIHSKNQLGRMDGMAEEYVPLGVNLHNTGKYELEENNNFYFRPPGYPYFVYYALNFYYHDKIPLLFSSQEEAQNSTQILYNHVYFAHNILFSLTVLVIFGIALHFLKPTLAFFISLLFGCNPYFLILIGLLHYEILHIFLLSLGTFLLINGLDKKTLGYLWLIFSGFCFGLATLVRPITLILPVFVFLGLLISEKKKIVPAAIKTLVFTFCMIVVIAPYSWRNYQLSNTFIPVNAQSGIALWSGTVKSLPIEPNHYRFWNLWYTDGVPIGQRVVGNKEHDIEIWSWARNNLELEKEFKKEAFSNLKKQPFTYVYNVTMNFISINLCVNSVFLKIFDYIQLSGNIFNKNFLASGNDQTFHKDWQANLFTCFVIILTICAGVGFYMGIKNRDFSILPVLAIYLCVTIAHSITYMDFMYYYVKMPFLFIFYAYFLKQLMALQNSKSNYILATAITLPGLLTLILLFNLILL